MNIRKIPVVLLIAAVLICSFSGCSYRVKDEIMAKKVYTCSNNNMFGLEKVAIFKDHVVVVLDKSKCENGCGGLSLKDHYDRSPSSVILANSSNNLPALDWDNCIQADGGKYVITTTFDINEALKIDPDKDIIVTGIYILGKRIDFYDGDFYLSYSIFGGECSNDYSQKYKNGKWGEVKEDLTLYPMTDGS